LLDSQEGVRKIVNQDLMPVLAQRDDMRIVEVEGQPVVTARDLARALEYRQEWAIHNLYNRNKESFTEKDVGVINLMTPSGEQQVRYFTKRGALKVCMKSNQPRAVAVQEMLIDLYEAVEGRRLLPVEALQEVQRRLDNLALEVRRLAAVQEAKVVYLPRSCRPWSIDNEAVVFLRGLFEVRPGIKVAEAISDLKNEAQKHGWRVGSKATLYRIAGKLREAVSTSPGRAIAGKVQRPGRPLISAKKTYAGREYLTTQEVAAMYGVSRRAVSKWIRENRIKAERVKGSAGGGRSGLVWMIPAAALGRLN
jgi:excisionase family DNA binding protein